MKKLVYTLEDRNNKGFSLMELIIVIVVLGTLAAVAVPVYGSIQETAEENVIKTDLSVSSKNLEMYKIDNGSYPRGTPLRIEDVVTVSKDAYDNGRDNNWLYCSNEEDYAIYALASSDLRIYSSSVIGSGASFDISANQDETCPALGIDGPNLESRWMKHEGEWLIGG